MPTKKQLSESMESQFEFPQTRREDDPAYVNPADNNQPKEQPYTMEKEYVVSIDVTEQISPDDWAVRRKTLKVTDETKMADIDKWYQSYKDMGDFQVTITELKKL
jgi:hypothetical protein